MAVDMLKLINGAFQLEASDIHLVTGAPPTFRVAGYLIPTDFAVMTPDGVRSCIEFLAGCSSHEVSDLNQVQKQANAVDFSCEIENVGRMRVHVFREKGNFGVNVRLISSSIPTVSRLGLPQVLIDICSRRGLTLVISIRTWGSPSRLTVGILLEISRTLTPKLPFSRNT
ncbi:MAG TPA: hypothetical protein GX529_04835, partial [Firmicutes bacterium]|nr:hypothetical protein [Candidatus Fermentithermobacillaceae bacterium]